MHLTPDEFIDAAEGTQREASLPHLSVCDACREHLAAMRATMAAAAEADVPEPSPLFWESFAARIHEHLETESDLRWWLAWTWPRVLIPLSAVALLALVVALVPNTRLGRPGSGMRIASTPTTAVPAANVDPATDVELAADPLLTLVADLSANMDLDGAAAAGLAGRNSAEQAVTHMNNDELRALQRLLQAELARPGA